MFRCPRNRGNFSHSCCNRLRRAAKPQSFQPSGLSSRRRIFPACQKVQDHARARDVLIAWEQKWISQITVLPNTMWKIAAWQDRGGLRRQRSVIHYGVRAILIETEAALWGEDTQE